MASNSPSLTGSGSALRTTKPSPAAFTGVSVASRTNEVSASASSTAAAAEPSTVMTLAAVAAATPAPGPMRTALRRSVGQKLGQRAVRGNRPHHHGRAVRGVDGRGRAAADQRHETGADAQRAARAEPGRAGAFGRTRDDDGVPARVFVRVEAWQRHRLAATATGRLANVRGATSSQHARGDADVGNPHLAAQQPPRQQQMPGLHAEEGDGARRLHHGAVSARRWCRRAHSARRPPAPACPMR